MSSRSVVYEGKAVRKCNKRKSKISGRSREPGERSLKAGESFRGPSNEREAF